MRFFSVPRSTVLAFLAFASAAQAAPASVSVTNPIKVPSMGGFSVGAGLLTVTYSDSQASAQETAAVVSLGKGQQFRMRTCVQVHLRRGVPDATCVDKDVDTRTSLLDVKVAAPTVSKSVARPAAGGQAYAAGQVIIYQRKADGSYAQVASSWPSAGLIGAGVSIAPLSGATAPLSQQGPYIDASNPPLTGGVNTGYPDSMCSPEEGSASGDPGAGVSTDALGSAPAYYEVGQPTGSYTGASPKGVILLFHGGGWYTVGAAAVAGLRSEADYWRAKGWLTINASYRPCGQSINDALWFYDRARAVYGSSLPYCTSGQSAGGHLALMVAAQRSTVGCVIDEAGPTDGLSLANQTAWGAKGAQTTGPRWVLNMMIAAFGQEWLGFSSPALWPINARILAAVNEKDMFIPSAQMTELHDSQVAKNPAAYVDVDVLAAGSVPWVHQPVSQTALDDLHAREDELVAPLT
jgi:acetyl esterase/lipase